MAYSSRTYTPGSPTTTFALTTSGGDPIGYIRESDIAVKVNGVTWTNAASGTNTYQFSGAGTVEQPSGGSIVLNTSVNSGTVLLERTTAIQDATVVYTAGSTLTSTDLNNADNQIRFGLQEFSDDYASLLGTGGNLTNLASFIGGSDTWVSNDAKAATTAAIDGRIDTKATAKVKDDIIATAPVSIADDSPSAGKITISVDAELTELATMSTGTAQALADLTGTEVQILDGATLSTAELNILDGVTSTATELNILDGVTASTAELNYVDGVTSNVQTQINAKQAADAQLTELATMSSHTAIALADLTQAEVEILDGATVSTAELNILDGVTATTAEINYVDGVTSNVQTQVDAKQPLDADLTTLAGMQAGTASILAGGTALTSTLTELNQLDGKTLGETSLTTNSNTAIPTSKAVADHVASSTTALGGFVAIAGPTNFPATQPAQGVVVSIKDVGSGFTTSSNEITITNGAGTGNNVRITGFPTSLAATTLQDDTGIQVTSDKNNSTSGSPNVHRYVYHKWLAKEDDIKALSDDINEFNERYRTDATGNNPNTNNHAGDLFFNQGSNTMYVRNGANNAWGEVTSTGDFKYLFLCPKSGGSGAPTFDGAEKEFDLRETSNSGTTASVTNAAQLMISVNGVVQKPNAGTNESGLDGFVLADANTIKFCGAPAANDEIFVIQSGSAVTLNAPANNTVSTDVLQNGSVTNVKVNASAAIDVSKLSGVMPLAGGTFTGDVVFDNATHAGFDITWDMSDKALEFTDNTKAVFGDGGDFEIYHDGTDNVLGSSGLKNIVLKPKDTDVGLKVIGDGACELYFDNSKEFETKSGGVKLNGHSESIQNNLGNVNSNPTFNFTVANYITLTLTGNVAVQNPTTESIGQSGSIIITQDATGSRTASWGNQFKWAGGTAPTLSTAANAVDRIDYVVVAADTIHCVASLAIA